MTEVAVAEKTKIILVGGMDYNVPNDLKQFFDIVKHITHGSKYNTLPQAEYIFVMTNYANHNIVEQVKGETKMPIIWLPQGWAAMKDTLQKRSLLPPDAPEVSAAPVAPAAHAAPSTLGLSEAEIWKKFGDKMMEACRTILEIGQKVTEKELLEVLAMAGPPPEDCKLFLPKLQMMGIVVPTKNDLWRLASSDNEAYEAEAPEGSEPEPVKKRKRVEVDLQRTDAEDRLRMIPGNPSLAARLLAGLRPGPYHTKRSIYVEMRKYKEFAGLSDNQVRSALERAIEQKIVDDTHKELMINHQYDLKLTLIEKQVAEEEPIVPKVLPVSEDAALRALMQSPAPSTMSQEDAQKKWCFVVERVQQVRQRVGDILRHCRIEWMGTNKVLVIFIPPVLSNCQKFLESMENWGSIHRTVQEHYTKDTVIRFMLDNGLRA
jgi:hypothetical protein